MNKRMILLLALILTSVLFTAVANAQESDEGVTCEHPRVVYLAEKTGADCQEILDLHSSGVGFGQIMKAAVVAEGLEGFEGEWTDLLAIHQEDVGWGQIAHAYGLAELYADPEITGQDLLDLKDSGLGWGEIRHAQAIAAAGLGVSFEQATAMMADGLEWEDIREQLGQPDGPPPWANGGNKDKDKVTGPPVWANGGKDKKPKKED